jgi:hypothetical protein
VHVRSVVFTLTKDRNNSCSADKGIFMDAAGPFSVFKFPPLDSTLTQMNLVCILKPYFLKIHFNIIFALPSKSLPFRFSTKIVYACSSLPCLVHLILLGYI